MFNAAAGAGATRIKAVSQTGSRHSVSPGLWSPAPGTILTDGHEAPRSQRSPRPAAVKDMLPPLALTPPVPLCCWLRSSEFYSPAAFSKRTAT